MENYEISVNKPKVTVNCKGKIMKEDLNITFYGSGTVPSEEKTVDLEMASGNQEITPSSGKLLSKVTITKPSTLIAGNIKKDVIIGGVTGTLESGPSVTYWNGMYTDGDN